MEMPLSPPAHLRPRPRSPRSVATHGWLGHPLHCRYRLLGPIQLISAGDLHRETGEAPLRQTLLEPPRTDAGLAQHLDRLRSEHAVGAPAVGDDLRAARELRDPPTELAQRDGERAGDVAGGELLSRPDVDYQRLGIFQPAHQLFRSERHQVVARLEVVACDLLDLRQAVTREHTEGGEEARDAVVREPVDHLAALTAAFD